MVKKEARIEAIAVYAPPASAEYRAGRNDLTCWRIISNTSISVVPGLDLEARIQMSAICDFKCCALIVSQQLSNQGENYGCLTRQGPLHIYDLANCSISVLLFVIHGTEVQQWGIICKYCRAFVPLLRTKACRSAVAV